MSETIKDIIAERELTFLKNDGTRYPCRLVFGKIYKEEGMGICCPFQILGYGDERIRKAWGEDSLQAFLLSVERANVDLAYWFKEEGKFLLYDSEELDLVARDLRQ